MTATAGAPPDLHEACYRGWVDRVRALLDAGADPNAPAPPGARTWLSDAGPRPRPLHCVALAWELGPSHVEVARLLLERGAVVEASVLRDLDVESVGSDAERELRALLASQVARRSP